MSERFSGNVSLGERKMCTDPLIELGESIGRSETELLQQLPLHRLCTLCVLDTERDGDWREKRDNKGERAVVEALGGEAAEVLAKEKETPERGFGNFSTE